MRVCLQSEDESCAPNVYHQAMYYWSFQKGLEGFCYDGSQDDPDIIGSPSWVHRSDQRLTCSQLFGIRKQVQHTVLINWLIKNSHKSKYVLYYLQTSFSYQHGIL